MRGPQRVPIWGERREYTWFIRDGFFVRSPTKFNGVDDRRGRTPEVRSRLSEAGAGARQEGATRQQRDARRLRSHDRRRHRRRHARASGRPGAHAGRQRRHSSERGSRNSSRRPISCASSSRKASTPWSAARRSTAARCSGSSTTPSACSAAPIAGGRARKPSDKDRARDAEFQRMMNKVALVTLWVEPKAHQIVKYTFDNVGFDFLPAAVARPRQRCQGDDDRGPAVSRGLAADQHGDQPRDDRSPSGRSTCATASSTTTTACRA